VAFSPDGRRIVSGSEDKTLKIWDADTGEETLTLRGHSARVLSAASSPDGRRIVSGGWDTRLKVWDADTGEEALTLRGHTRPVFSVAFSPDGRRIVSGSWDKTLKVWDANTGEETLTLRGHSDQVRSVVFSPNGDRIVSGSEDGTLKIWDSVPYRIRYRERQAILAAQPEAEHLVEDLFRKHSKWGTVAERLREDTSLTDPVRHVALNEVLRRATASREKASSTQDGPEAKVPE
jgi:WD40 repeat protein